MKAIFVVPVNNANPKVPIELLTLGDNPIPDGRGYSCLGPVPVVTTCLVLVNGSEEGIAQMAALDDYLFVEEVVDDTAKTH